MRQLYVINLTVTDVYIIDALAGSVLSLSCDTINWASIMYKTLTSARESRRLGMSQTLSAVILRDGDSSPRTHQHASDSSTRYTLLPVSVSLILAWTECPQHWLRAIECLNISSITLDLVCPIHSLRDKPVTEMPSMQMPSTVSASTMTIINKGH